MSNAPLLALFAPLVPLAPLLLPAQEAPKPGAAVPISITKPYRLNLRTEDELVLADLEGKSHALYAENPGLPIVLVFWGYKDPISLAYAPKLAELAQQHAGKAAFYLVDSNYDELVSGTDALAKLREVVAREKVTLPLLVDPGNKLADDFEATANGQAYLLDSNHFLRYHGGIDDDPHGERAKQGLAPRTWLANALTEVLAGQIPKENWTRPSGRVIKRAPKAGVPSGGPKK